MKKLITMTGVFILGLILAIPLQAQQQTGIHYQAVARESDGKPIAGEGITVVLAIRSGSESGQVMWEETHSLTTSPQGLFSLALGTDPGAVTGQEVDNLGLINWNENAYYLNVQVNGNDMGTKPILAVPHALYGRDEDADPANEIQDLALNKNGELSVTGNNQATAINLRDFVLAEMRWQQNADTVYMFDSNVGVGTASPEGVLEVQGSMPGDEPIFQVKNDQGVPVFSVYNEGVRVYVPDDLSFAKGEKGGFAVGGYNRTKQLPTDEYFLQVMPEGANINFFTRNDGTKGVKGGFAVGGYNNTKSEESSFIYMDPYAVPYTGDFYLFNLFEALDPKGNCYLGTMAGQKRLGQFNTSIGYQAGYSLDATAGFIGNPPVYISNAAKGNTILGAFAGYTTSTGDQNTYIGYKAGYNNEGSGNVFIGYLAGFQASNANNKLYIDNEDTADPLISGDFSNDYLEFNGYVGAGISPTSLYALSVNGGSSSNYSLRVYKGAYASGSGFVSASDARLKKNVVPLEDALSSVLQLNGVLYQWRDEVNDLEGNPRQLGLIAQEVETVLPEVVTEDENGYKGIAYDKLTALLIEAVKEQQSIIDELKMQVRQQDKKIASLESENRSEEEVLKKMADLEKTIGQLTERIESMERYARK